MEILNIHYHNGCVVFLNADIDNVEEAGKITRCSKKFKDRFEIKS